MGIKFEGQVLKFGTVDKCNRKFAPDCKITFPEKIPVAYNFDMDEIIGHADISKVEDGLKGVVSLFDTNILLKRVFRWRILYQDQDACGGLHHRHRFW